MAEQSKEPRNISDKEIAIIQATITEDVLKLVRALFFGLPISDLEKARVKEIFADEQLKAIVWKRFYPQLDRDTPIGQVQDSWLGAEQMVFGNSPDTIKQALEYKQQALILTKQGLELLSDPSLKAPDLTYSPTQYPQDPLGIALLARNQYIRHVEQQLLFLLLLSKQKQETPEQTAKKQKQDSAQ